MTKSYIGSEAGKLLQGRNGLRIGIRHETEGDYRDAVFAVCEPIGTVYVFVWWRDHSKDAITILRLNDNDGFTVTEEGTMTVVYKLSRGHGELYRNPEGFDEEIKRRQKRRFAEYERLLEGSLR